jgi:D-psicose/D-tagatose/L-ribulose 3-epimerase
MPELACSLSVRRPVARDEAEAMGEGLPLLRNKARRCGLI